MSTNPRRPLPHRVCRFCAREIVRHRAAVAWLLRDVGPMDRVSCIASVYGSHRPVTPGSPAVQYSDPGFGRYGNLHRL